MRIQWAGKRDFQEPRFVRLEHGSIWLHFSTNVVAQALASVCWVLVAKLWQVSAGSLTRKPKQKRTSVATPLIPKHFSPGCFVINIPKGAEDLIKSILLKGRFSKVCLQVPASRQHLCSHTLLCHPKPGAGRGLDFLC